MRVSVYECPPVSVNDVLFHTPVLLQVLASRVVVVPVVLSLSVAVAQSYVTVSVQTTRYQNDRTPPPAGALKFCATELSPSNGELLPTLAADAPLCAVVATAVLPALVQLASPLSNPPLVIPLDAVTVSVTVALCVALGALPMTVTGYVPGAVVASTLSVSVELEPAVTAPGLKDAVAPAGIPLAESVSVSAEPLVTAVEIVDVALPLCTAETLLGFALIEKSLGAGVTVRVTAVLCVALEAVPVTVTEYGPGVVAAPTLMVSVEPPPAVVVGGLNEAVAPAGTPLALSVTVSAEPLVTAVEMVDVALPPWTADTLAGSEPIEKSLGADVTLCVPGETWGGGEGRRVRGRH